MTTKTQDFVETLKAYDFQKHDELDVAQRIEYRESGFLFRGERVGVTGTAVGQMCCQLGIPADFFTNVMSADERSSVFNRLNKEHGEVERLYRFSDNTLYGVVSPRYKRLDNIRILDILESASDSGIGLKPVKFNLDPDHSKFKFVPDNAQVGELMPMIEFVNSENGLGCLQILAGVYRLVCTNGMSVPVSDITRSKWMHLGFNDIRLPDFGVVLNQSRKYVELLDESRTRYISSDSKAEFVLEIGDRLGHKVAERVTSVANREYNSGRTLFDIVNSVTRAAQSFSPIKQTDIEAYASKLLAA